MPAPARCRGWLLLHRSLLPSPQLQPDSRAWPEQLLQHRQREIFQPLPQGAGNLTASSPSRRGAGRQGTARQSIKTEAFHPPPCTALAARCCTNGFIYYGVVGEEDISEKLAN